MGMFKDLNKMNKQAKEIQKSQGKRTGMIGMIRDMPGQIDITAQAQGVPADRQLLTLYLPNERVSNMMPGVGMPTQFVVGRDPASEAVVSALAG